MSWQITFILLLAAALLMLWLGRRARAVSGLPNGRLVYSDTTGWRRVERPLFSRSQLLTGRPDYLVQHGDDVIPVEIKSGRASPSGPYPAHVLQLAAYCFLVEEAYERRPPYGIIVYRAAGGSDDRQTSYEVPYTHSLEENLLAVLDEMRAALERGQAPRDHHQPARCRACGYRTACDQALE